MDWLSLQLGLSISIYCLFKDPYGFNSHFSHLRRCFSNCAVRGLTVQLCVVTMLHHYHVMVKFWGMFILKWTNWGCVCIMYNIFKLSAHPQFINEVVTILLHILHTFPCLTPSLQFPQISHEIFRVAVLIVLLQAALQDLIAAHCSNDWVRLSHYALHSISFQLSVRVELFTSLPQKRSLCSKN